MGDPINRGYDATVGVVGAGFAGLSAALTIRRHRHSVVVFDGGPCRNHWAQEVHSYLGLHGVSGEEMRRIAFDQVRAVGGEIREEGIEGARREGDALCLTEAQGREHRVRRLVLATGVRDVLPEIENFDEFWGCSVHVCPHCDGYEVRDQPVAIVAWSEAALPFTLRLTQWTRDITVVTDGHAPELSEADQAELARLDIPVFTGDVVRFEGERGQISGLRFADGPSAGHGGVLQHQDALPEGPGPPAQLPDRARRHRHRAGRVCRSVLPRRYPHRGRRGVAPGSTCPPATPRRMPRASRRGSPRSSFGYPRIRSRPRAPRSTGPARSTATSARARSAA